MRFRDYDDDVVIEDFGHKTCPECGGVMYKESEYYDVGRRHEDKWWQCRSCGHCEERWS